MKISYQWLCEILPGLEKYSAATVAEKLTFAGLEVEALDDLSKKLHGIVVAKVIHKEKHPQADKLSVCRVQSAAGQEVQVVCGAPNVTEGKKYPFATLGTIMPDGLVIKPVKLRGVESCGMLCSAKELQIASDADGLYTLSDDLPVGLSVSEALRLNDTIYEINVTPNRGDALSHWGVARDVAALFGLTVRFENIVPRSACLKESKEIAVTAQIDFKHEDTKFCARFSLSQIHGIDVAPSPTWLSRRIENLGQRSINNIVDATNYVMLLTGHPVHAYDLRELHKQTLKVQTLEAAQKMTTLDGVERELVTGDLVIADGERVVGLAGIMGGANSEIKSDTKDIVLEVAYFDPDVVRKTSKRLGLQTDSSYRFERFVNPETVLKAHEVLRDLIFGVAGGTGTEILDSYPVKFLPVTVVLKRPEIKRLLGIEIATSDITRILRGLGCELKEQGEDFVVTPPAARSDLKRPIDLIEELARLHGLEKIPAELPRLVCRSPKENPSSQLAHTIKEMLVSFGFYETVNYSFTDANYLRMILSSQDEVNWIHLQNPIAEDRAVMRPSLLPQLLECYLKNYLKSAKGMRFFELRRVYRFTEEKKIEEKLVLAGILAGMPFGRNRFGKNRESDFFETKGLLQNIFERCGANYVEATLTDWPFHPGQAEYFSHNDAIVARFGGLHPKLIQQLKIKESLSYFEIDFDALSMLQNTRIQYQAINSLPPVYRDLTLIMPKSMAYGDLEKIITKEKPDALKFFQIVDLYTGENIPVDKKSITLSISYESKEQSFTDEEVNKMHFELVDKLKNALGVELR